MKAKVSRGGGFKGALNYVFDAGLKATGKWPEFLGGNMSGQTPQTLAREFGITKSLRPDCKKPVWHCSLALPKGERLSAQKWGELAKDFMLEMGMDPANFLYSAVRHNDTDFDHIHIVASRIGLDGSLWHGKFEALKAIEATQKLEKMHGLTLTPGFDLEHKKERKSLTHGELNMAIRTEMKPPRMVCQDAIDEVLRDKGVTSAPQFIERLAALGVRAVPSVASTGTMNGFSFEAEGVSFTGSKLGEGYKWAKLQLKGVEYVKNRDFEELADAKRRAGERAGVGPNAGRDLGEAGPDRAPGAELGAAAELGGGASERVLESTGPDFEDAPGRDAGAGGLRPGDRRATIEPGEHGFGDQRPGNQGHGVEGWGAGQDLPGSGQPGAGLEIELVNDAAEQQEPASAADSAGHSSTGGGGNAGEQQPGSPQSGAERAPEPLADIGPDAGRSSAGGATRGGWASRFKQNSAANRDAAKRRVGGEGLEPSNGKREKVTEPDRVEARTIDPTVYLNSQGFDVRQEGRHLSVRLHGDEVYRCTRKDDGHWVTCDRFENGVGDNIALVQELEPGTGFAESVYRLSGAPSVARATRPAPAPVVRKPPQIPAQGREDVRIGREYLQGRGISLETCQQAEKAGMLRYSAGGLLFVGRDEHGTAQNITRRAVNASEQLQRRDLSGTDKRHPQMLPGSSETVVVVEGGVDALAAHDLARRQGRPAPTVLVSGGANVRSWIETPWVQAVLRLAKRIIVAFERETDAETQVKTDAAHQLQMQRLRQVCGAEVVDWKPPQGAKDMAALNEQRQAAASAPTKEAHALRVQERLQQHRESPDQDRSQGMSM